nr:hypothetical protein [Haladaptatus pallidirubidus]
MLTAAGLRTFASSHDAYDPLSYHRGSVWPHDTSIVAMGFAERGRRDVAEILASKDCRLSPTRFGRTLRIGSASPSS